LDSLSVFFWWAHLTFVYGISHAILKRYRISSWTRLSSVPHPRCLPYPAVVCAFQRYLTVRWDCAFVDFGCREIRYCPIRQSHHSMGCHHFPQMLTRCDRSLATIARQYIKDDERGTQCAIAQSLCSSHKTPIDPSTAVQSSHIAHAHWVPIITTVSRLRTSPNTACAVVS
jgi:hypothetical protein